MSEEAGYNNSLCNENTLSYTDALCDTALSQLLRFKSIHANEVKMKIFCSDSFSLSPIVFRCLICVINISVLIEFLYNYTKQNYYILELSLIYCLSRQ